MHNGTPFVAHLLKFCFQYQYQRQSAIGVIQLLSQIQRNTLQGRNQEIHFSLNMIGIGRGIQCHCKNSRHVFETHL